MNSSREAQLEHVVDLVQDVLLGQVDAVTSARVRAHLASCDECAADYAFAFRLRDASLTTQADAELVAFLSTIEAPAIAATHRTEAGRTSRRLTVRPTRVGLSLLAAAAAVVLLLRPWSSDDFASLARLEPLPVNITREVPEAGSFEAARMAALGAYRSADYAAALTLCENALRMRPVDGELRIYAASAEALLGRLPAAASRLDSVLADATQPPAILREARWQRAQVALLADDKARAREELDCRAATNGLRQEDARAQIHALDLD